MAEATGQDSRAIRVERRGSLATLTLDRPPLNVLDLATLSELGAEISVLAADPELQLVVLAGSERAFSAGVAVEDHTPERVPEMLALFHGALRELQELPAITLAAVRGHCLGGGLELAAACDLLLADAGAGFGQPEIGLGCFPPFAAALFPARLGRGRTLELLATGRRLDAAEAARLGLATWVAQPGQFDERLDELVAKLTAGSTAVTRLIKRAVDAGATLPFPQALAESERLYLEELTRTDDMQEGLAAFLAKRPPSWNHR